MTGLNHTGLGVSLALPSGERGAFERVFDPAIMLQSLVDALMRALSAGARGAGGGSKLGHVSNETEAPTTEDSTEPSVVLPRRRRDIFSDKSSSVLGIVGESLITIGAIVLLFLVWQLYINNAVLANEQTSITKDQALARATVSPSPVASGTTAQTDFGPPPRVVAALMMFVFPWVDTFMTPRDVTVRQ